MREFFKSQKRKLGLVTLLLACALTAIWVRGLRVKTEFGFGRMATQIPGVPRAEFVLQIKHPWSTRVETKSFYHLISSDRIEWRRIDATQPGGMISGYIGFQNSAFEVLKCRRIDSFSGLKEYEWRWQFLGLDFGTRYEEIVDENDMVDGAITPAGSRQAGLRMTYWYIPYWFLVIPLILLSAYLLIIPSSKFEKLQS